ncbi:4665_t:CDS:2 [Dentiscutata erythropus]|uniref:4665_t:CDS:1 n=1 Tax=Dentiscutata erythropus TaxID=1348616 RepID=A0A9N9B5D7_9GLOM|nr:4665_t:CDS:2 [Dentiscutata erythropus]
MENKFAPKKDKSNIPLSKVNTNKPPNAKSSEMISLVSRIQALEAGSKHKHDENLMKDENNDNTSKDEDLMNDENNDNTSKDEDLMKDENNDNTSKDEDLMKDENNDNTSKDASKTFSIASTCVSTPVDVVDNSKAEVLEPIDAQPNTTTTQNDLPKKDIEMNQTTKISSFEQQYKDHLKNLDLEHEKLLSQQKQEYEKIIQNLKIDLEKAKSDNNKLSVNENNGRLGNESPLELSSIYEAHKERLIKEIQTIKSLKEQAEDNLLANNRQINDQKIAIKKYYEREIEKIRIEHAQQMDSLRKGDIQTTFDQIQNREVAWIQYQRDNDELFKQLEFLDKTVQEKNEAEAEIAYLQQELARSQQEVKTLTRARENTNKMIGMFQQKIEDTISNLSTQLNEKQKQVNESAATIESLRKQVKEHDSRHKRLASESNSLSFKNNEVLQIYEAMEETANQLSEMESKYAKLNSEHQQVTLENQRLLTDLSSFSLKLQDLQSKNDEWEKKYQDMIVQRDQLNNELSDLKLFNSNKTKDLKDLTDDIVKLKNQNESLKEITDEIQVEKESWQQKESDLIKMHEVELKNKDEKIGEISKELENAHKQSDELKEQIKVINNNLSNLEKKKDALSELLEKQQTDIQGYMNDLISEREAWNRKEADIISNYENRLGRLVQELRDTENAATQVHLQANSKMKNIQSKHDKSTNEIEELQNKLTELSQLLDEKNAELMKHDQEKEELLKVHEDNISSLKQQQEEEVTKLTELMEILEKKQRAIKNTAETHRLSTRRSNAEAKKIVALEQRVMDLEQTLKVSNIECERLYMEREKLNEKVLELKSKYAGTIVNNI